MTSLILVSIDSTKPLILSDEIQSHTQYTVDARCSRNSSLPALKSRNSESSTLINCFSSNQSYSMGFKSGKYGRNSNNSIAFSQNYLIVA